jgi:thiamine-phosphate diphosphorylase
MSFELPQLYPLTDAALSGLSHAEQVERLMDGGATLIQLREKDLSPVEFYRQAKAALGIARQRRVRIIINDRVDLALALRADGVHLGQSDLPPLAARRLLGENAIIGLSTHSADQARQPLFQLITWQSALFSIRRRSGIRPARWGWKAFGPCVAQSEQCP